METKLTEEQFTYLLEMLNFKGDELQILYRDKGARKLIVISAEELYSIARVIDWDEVQDGD